jgi:hypothetical protein
MKKTVCLLLALLLVLTLCGISNAQSVLTERKNALALKGGYRIADSSDFTDFWGVDKKDYNNFIGEISYERKFTSYLGLEAALGYSAMSKYHPGALYASDSLDTRFTNLYLSPSLKLYLPVRNFSLYIGAGPDYYFTMGKVRYSMGSLYYNDTKTFSSFGFHGLAGMEYVFYRNPAEDNFYDWPVSFLIEYKYSKVTVSDADEGLIDYVNQNIATSYSKHDLEVGGHAFMIGLRWHF